MAGLVAQVNPRRPAVLGILLGRIFGGEPVSTSPENAPNELLWIERNHRHGSPFSAGRWKAGVMAELPFADNCSVRVAGACRPFRGGKLSPERN